MKGFSLLFNHYFVQLVFRSHDMTQNPRTIDIEGIGLKTHMANDKFIVFSGEGDTELTINISNCTQLGVLPIDVYTRQSLLAIYPLFQYGTFNLFLGQGHHSG